MRKAVPSIPTANKKKRGDSPEKVSPSTSAEPHESKRIDVIWDEALENLRIKENDWSQACPDNMGSYRPSSVIKFAVKKRKNVPVCPEALTDNKSRGDASEMLSGRKVTVVKVAPENSKVEELKVDTVVGHGKDVRFSGRVKRISAEKQRQITTSSAQRSSIIHHEERMIERQQVQEHLMTKLNRESHQLTMNVEVREKEFERDVVNRLLPFAEMKGHGYWKGAEFWRQHRWIGGEERGIYETPGQVERGFPAPIEHIGLTKPIRSELSMAPAEPPVPSQLAERFRQLKRGYGLAGDLEPHTPDLSELIILPARKPQAKESGSSREFDQCVVTSYHESNSTNDAGEVTNRSVLENGSQMLSKIPDVLPSAPILGPALQVCDKLLKPNQQFPDPSEPLEARLVFECMGGGPPCKNAVELSNVGSTVVFYSWHRLPVEDVFKPYSTKPILSLLAANPSENFEDISQVPPLPPVPSQRFYFDATNGVLLPGAKISVPVVFKSALAGVFTERWMLVPTPPAMPSIIINFRGVAAQPDKNARVRAELTTELLKREALSICQTIVSSLVNGVRTPPRPASPIGEPGRKRKGLAFRQQNEEINFDWEIASDMEKMWDTACQIRTGQTIFTDEAGEVLQGQMPGEEWDLSVDTLYVNAAEPLPEDLEDGEEGLEKILSQVNQNVARLGFSEFTSQCDQKGTTGRILLSTAIDSVSDQALSLRQALGLPMPPDIQLRPSSAVSQPPPQSRGAPGTAATGGKNASAAGGDQRGSGKRGTAKTHVASQHSAEPSNPPSAPPPLASESSLGIIRTPSDLATVDASQALVVGKYVDKFRTSSRVRIKDLLSSLVDNVADIVENRGEKFSIP